MTEYVQPKRVGGHAGTDIERVMEEQVDGVDGIRKKVLLHPDGSTVRLDTRAGNPRVIIETPEPPPPAATEARGKILCVPCSLDAQVGWLSPFTMDGNGHSLSGVASGPGDGVHDPILANVDTGPTLFVSRAKKSQPPEVMRWPELESAYDLSTQGGVKYGPCSWRNKEVSVSWIPLRRRPGNYREGVIYSGGKVLLVGDSSYCISEVALFSDSWLVFIDHPAATASSDGGPSPTELAHLYPTYRIRALKVYRETCTVDGRAEYRLRPVYGQSAITVFQSTKLGARFTFSSNGSEVFANHMASSFADGLDTTRNMLGPCSVHKLKLNQAGVPTLISTTTYDLSNLRCKVITSDYENVSFYSGCVAIGKQFYALVKTREMFGAFGVSNHGSYTVIAHPLSPAGAQSEREVSRSTWNAVLNETSSYSTAEWQTSMYIAQNGTVLQLVTIREDSTVGGVSTEIRRDTSLKLMSSGVTTVLHTVQGGNCIEASSYAYQWHSSLWTYDNPYAHREWAGIIDARNVCASVAPEPVFYDGATVTKMSDLYPGSGLPSGAECADTTSDDYLSYLTRVRHWKLGRI